MTSGTPHGGTAPERTAHDAAAGHDRTAHDAAAGHDRAAHDGAAGHDGTAPHDTTAHDGAASADRAWATPARMYDYYLGGVHNFPADREAAEGVMARLPLVRTSAQANRAFLRRAVRHVVGSGVRQLLDIGSGLPTEGNVHEIAQGIDPASRVVYVDIDTLAVAESQELLEGNTRARAIWADINEPQAILDHPQVRDLLDFDRPIGLVLAAVLHFVADDAHAYGLVAQLLGPLPPGSFLVLSHAATEAFLPYIEHWQGATGIYEKQAGTATAGRVRPMVERFFAGTELEEPGVVWASEWHPDGPVPPEVDGHPERSGSWVGVGRKR